MIVLVLCLRVNPVERDSRIDMPELVTLQLGTNAMRYREKDKSTELIMRSG